MLRKVLTAAAFAATVSVSVQASAFQPLESDPKELVFGIISTESSQNLKRQWDPFLEDMQASLGMPVKAFFAPDYAGIIEAQRFGKVHVAWYGNKSAMEAVDRAGAEIFVRQTKVDGSEGYYSHVITHVSNPVNDLAGMFAECGKGKSYGNGDPNSTSGFLVPSFYVWAQNNMDPKDCFKTVRSANHEANLMAAANKQVDYANNNSEQLVRTQMNAPDAANQVKAIWTSPLIPADPIAYRKDLSVELKNSIQGFFLSYGRIGTPEQVAHAKEVLAGMSDGQGPFRASDDTQLYPIRELELFKNRIKIANDERLEAADKAAKLAEIDAQLAKLKVLASGF